MQCPSCGQENKNSARFCAFCGAVLDGEPGMLQSGQLVDGGTYRIIRPLGKGGMGAVYLAANTKAFGRQCVVKEIIEYYDPSEPEARNKAIQRFEIEARTLAALKHSGIPDIYAYFFERGRNYLVMEYIEGPNLAQGLTRDKDGQTIGGRPQPVEDVVRHTIQICEVLAYLEKHQPPVVHNDIKPANIILDKNTEQAVLVDFGTAKTRYAPQAAGQPGRQQSSVYGTVGYAAPELYEGSVEPRSDVYALAATAYHLLTDDDPRAHPFNFPEMDTIPAPLRQVLLGALEVKVEKRLSAEQFSKKLTDVLYPATSHTVRAAPIPPLTFPQRGKAATREELIALCIKNLDYASEILYDGSMIHWLRDALHDPVAARTAEAAIQKYPDNPNAGLEYLIRSLDPKAMPPPQLKVITGRLQYDRATDKNSSQEIKIANTGGGYLYGTVTSSAPWVQVEQRIKCAPGQTRSFPVTIDVKSLTPGQIYRAKVEIEASGAQSASIPVEVRVPPPQINIEPMQIYLGAVSRRQMFTDRASFKVQNTGESRAVCQIEGNPRWLVLDPAEFTCLPGRTQTVELVGRIDLLPAEGKRHGATLYVNIEGRHARQVQVMLRTKTGKGQGSGLGSFIMIGCAILALLGASIWFVITVLPLLIP